MKTRGETISIYLPSRIKKMLEKLCKEYGESKSRLMSSLIEEKHYKETNKEK